MHVSKEKIEKLTRKRGISLKTLLKEAGVSKTAYYNLIYNDTLLPHSLVSIAEYLGVRPSHLLEETHPDVRRLRKVAEMSEKIYLLNPESDPENIRHTLLLLLEEPKKRLDRSLTRGRGIPVNR